MTRIDWLKARINENDMDYKLIQDVCYEDYCNTFKSDISLKSYKDTVKKAYDTLIRQKNDVDEDFDIEQNIKLEKNLQKRADLTTYLRRNNRNEYRLLNYTESLYEELIKKLDDAKFDIPTIKEVKIPKESKSAILCLSDLHFGTLINGKTEEDSYDFDIANRRLKKYISKSIDTMKKNDVSCVYVALLGDFISSIRRNDEKLGNVSSQTNTCLIVITILEQILAELCTNFNKVILTGVVGNEARLTDLIEYHPVSVAQNLDYMILIMLKHILDKKIKNLEINIPENPIKTMIKIPIKNRTYNVCIAHGNLVKSLKDDCEELYTKSFLEEEGVVTDLTIFGHYHRTLVLSSGRLLVTGCLFKNNCYALNTCGTKGHAFQTLIIIQNDGSYWSLPMKLDDISDIKEGYKIQKELDYMSYNKSSNVNVVDIKISYN